MTNGTKQPGPYTACHTSKDNPPYLYGIDGPGQVVFSFDVEGKKFKDFDVFAKAGGARRALIETVPVTITDGELTIAFTAQLENTFICGVEIIPAP